MITGREAARIPPGYVFFGAGALLCWWVAYRSLLPLATWLNRLFGWKIAAMYLGTGLAVAMIAGWMIGRIRMERHVEPWVYEAIGMAGEGVVDARITPADRIRHGLDAMRDIVGRVWIYIVLGIAVGAGSHGYVPMNFLPSFMGRGAWWSVPLSVVIGIMIVGYLFNALV